MVSVIVYNQDLAPVAVLENAFGIGYEQRINETWTAQFSLPATDPKVEECQLFRFVEIFDGGERVELFRIITSDLGKQADGPIITYGCEHVLATLLDNIMFQYQQTTNLSPADTIGFILGFQSTVRWEVGTIDFTDLYSYKWENENLLSALLLITKTYSDEYMWTFDTTVYPWKLNLIRPETEPSAVIRYRRNLVKIDKKIDQTYICTRLYPLGYGEGVNQLTIKDVNGGIPYIDADTIGTYGVISLVYSDSTEEDAATLLAKGQAYIENNKNPRITYSVNGGDLYQITQEPLDKFTIGAMIQVYDDELNIAFASRVVVKTKNDITGTPGDIDLQISSKIYDAADTATQLKRQVDISNTYSQGAVNIDTQSFADNCDDDHPAVIKFYVPSEAVNINKLALSYECEAFRAYEQATNGGGSISTSTANGGATVLSVPFDDYGTVNFGNILDPSKSFIVPVNNHNHGISNGTDLATASGGSVEFESSGGHYHLLYDFQIAVDLPDHTHNFTLPNHSHSIRYGIYEGPTATAITVKVDGNTVTGTGTSETDMDIVPYLSKDSNGKILRGVFHTIEITPNDLTRITGNIVSQLFIQSRGGDIY